MEIQEWKIKLGMVKLGLIAKRNPNTYTEKERKAMLLYNSLDVRKASEESLKMELI